MKLIRCTQCSIPIALTRSWLNCECGKSGGAYLPDGDCVVISGPCGLYGISNRIFFGMRGEAFPYNETTRTKNGKLKVMRLTDNPGCFPERTVS